MTIISFQNVDNFTQLGCYMLVRQSTGDKKIKKVPISELLSRESERKILFRSKIASLKSCTCDLLINNVAIITITSREWEGNGNINEVFVKNSDSIACFRMKIKMAIQNMKYDVKDKQCPYCKITNTLTLKEREMIAMLRNNKSIAMITKLQKNKFKSSTYYGKYSVMKKVGIANTIGFYHFVNLN